MSELSRVKLSDVAKVSTGFAFKGNEYCDEGIRVVRGENVSLGELRWDTIKCWNQPFSQLEKYSLCDGDIVIGMDGSRVGRNRAQIKKSDLPLLLAQRVARVNAKSGYSQNLIAYIIKSSIFEQYVTRVHTGTSIPHISQKQIEDFSFDIITDYTTQTAIAEILSSLDDKIELNNKINQELENLAQTLFKRWFVDFEFPYENGEPYKSSGGEMVESELGEIPKGWVIYKMSDLLETISKTYPLKNVDNVIFLNTGDIHEGKFLHQNISDSQKLPGQAKKSIQKNDILYSEIRPANKRFAFVYFDSSKYVVSTKLMVLRSKVPFNSLFQYFLLTQNEQIDYLQQLAESRSGTFPQITFSEVSTIKMALPDFQKVNKFVDSVLEPFFTEKFNSELENQKLTNLRDTLLPKLISGELEVQQVLSQMT
jgi:type I restriction enzyme S subunit